MNAVVVALAGGVLIGLSAVLLMLTLGRIAGISGIVGGLFDSGSGEAGWRLAAGGWPLSRGLWLGPIVEGGNASLRREIWKWVRMSAQSIAFSASSRAWC